MVLSFFRKSTAGLDHVVSKSVTMLGDARHSFDLATTAVLSGGDAAAVADDVRSTDQRINDAERELRSELVVHVSVQGATDIGEVLGLILLLKKIERIGDQAKNILDLAESGVSFANADDTEELTAQRQTISGLFVEAAELLADYDDIPADFIERANGLTHSIQDTIDGYLSSDRPGHEVVPRAIYARYLKRIVANLLGVVRSATEPIHWGDDNRDVYGDLDD
jgi:hypothetical protein